MATKQELETKVAILELQVEKLTSILSQKFGQIDVYGISHTDVNGEKCHFIFDAGKMNGRIKAIDETIKSLKEEK